MLLFLFIGLDIVSSRIQKRQWHPTPVLLPGKSQGQWSLMGCHPCGCTESDTTEQFHFHFQALEKEMANPLQCSCLENPRDGGAWWAAVYGVTESDTTEATQQQQQPRCICKNRERLWSELLRDAQRTTPACRRCSKHAHLLPSLQ